MGPLGDFANKVLADGKDIGNRNQTQRGKEMKLDRNITDNKGRGKYALVLLRRLAALERQDREAFAEVWGALQILERHNAIDYGETNSTGEFFVMRLKDQHAYAGLSAYSADAGARDPEWGAEIMGLARRAGRFNPYCKNPD
jgi:hypothetical protein